MRGRRNHPKMLGAGHRAPTGNFELDSKRNPYFAQLDEDTQELDVDDFMALIEGHAPSE
ncbi:MAG: hypothetical protein ACE5MG_03450 [Candidatus Methylomirabilales bacterium]